MSLNYRPLYADTDSIKMVYPLTAEQRKYIAKCFLNAQYGTMVTNYKENNMRKDFIVVHCGDNQPKIIRKDAIIVVDKMKGRSGEECRVWLTSGDCFLVTETYNEIVKRLFEC